MERMFKYAVFALAGIALTFVVSGYLVMMVAALRGLTKTALGAG